MSLKEYISLTLSLLIKLSIKALKTSLKSWN